MNWRSLTFSIIRRLTSRIFPNVEWITSKDLARWLNDPVKPQPIVFDTRSEAEYALSHLKDAERIDPDYPNLATLTGVSKDMPIVVYCSVGYRSAKIAERLGQAGFSQVYNLEGSIFQWVNVGRPVFKDGDPRPLVYPYDALWGRLLKSQYRAALTQVEKRSSAP